MTAFDSRNHVWNRHDRVVFEYYSDFDEDGRRRFTIIRWVNEYHLGPMVRAQAFNADPTPYLERYKGKEITERVMYDRA